MTKTKGTSDYIEWNKLENISNKLFQNQDYVIWKFIVLAMYTGLRYSDIAKLTYDDILNHDKILFQETKTKKRRPITISNELKTKIKNYVDLINITDLNQVIIQGTRSNGKAVSNIYINKKLGEIKGEFKLKGTISAHSIRKSFGRRVFEIMNETEKALVLLSEIFQHSSTAITRRYLGITSDEISDVYLSL